MMDAMRKRLQVTLEKLYWLGPQACCPAAATAIELATREIEDAAMAAVVQSHGALDRWQVDPSLGPLECRPPRGEDRVAWVGRGLAHCLVRAMMTAGDTRQAFELQLEIERAWPAARPAEPTNPNDPTPPEPERT